MDIWMVILNGGIAIFASVVAFFTYKAWKEKNESNIEVRLDTHPVYSSTQINICVENHGPGNARDLKFKITPSTTGDLFTRPIESLGFIKYGISRLNGGTRRESALTSIIGKFEKQQKYPVEVEVKYYNLVRTSIRKSRKKIFILDFREFERVAPVPGSVKYLEDISRTLKDIENNIKKFINGSATPRVTVLSSLETNMKNIIGPFVGFNSIEEIPVDVQREKIQEIHKIISHNPWYDFYTELSRLPPEVQMNILFELQSNFADWIDQQGS